MKVLFINVWCGVGSHGKIAAEQADKFASEGHEVKIAYGRTSRVPDKYKHYAIRIGSTFDTYTHALMTRLTDKHGFYSRNATRKFLRWAEDYNPDILWLHNIHGYYINVELLFNWIKSRPSMKVFWTLHDCWSFTGHCAWAFCDKWRTHCEKCDYKKEYPTSIYDNSYKNFERKRNLFTGIKDLTLITPSKWLADLVKQSFLREYPVEVRYNTIDTNIFKPTPSNFREKYNLVNKSIILGVASVWEKRKGLYDFVKLNESLDHDKFAIVLVGIKPEQKKLLPQNINPTYQDNFPTVNLEAEACGTPVITYDTGGSSETIHNPESIVVKVGDLEAVKNFLATNFHATHEESCRTGRGLFLVNQQQIPVSIVYLCDQHKGKHSELLATLTAWPRQ